MTSREEAAATERDGAGGRGGETGLGGDGEAAGMELGAATRSGLAKGIEWERNRSRMRRDRRKDLFNQWHLVSNFLELLVANRYTSPAISPKGTSQVVSAFMYASAFAYSVSCCETRLFEEAFWLF